MAVYLAIGSVAGIGVGVLISFVFSRIRAGGYLNSARREAGQLLSDAERDAAAIIKDGKTSLKELEINLRSKL